MLGWPSYLIRRSISCYFRYSDETLSSAPNFSGSVSPLNLNFCISPSLPNDGIWIYRLSIWKSYSFASVGGLTIEFCLPNSFAPTYFGVSVFSCTG